MNQLNDELEDMYLGDGDFYYKQNQYVYFVKLKETDRYEIGFGNNGQGFSENVQNTLATKRDNALRKINNISSKKNYKNAKWVCTQFYVSEKNSVKDFLSAIKTMLGLEN
ncbi:MAG: hypothetical protein IIX47_02455 [Spirochaetaceae bacterium]|nr:hypothetical protein [Spirochaetaceae bacterium]